ncbi:BnaAnng02950D [Brassica napus]|uniref:BnaAnng02950D protein n=1 Tax=Brassica napus TaxID=3708 RepID=A0A078FWM1_BRANA|nr:BnaAnng02950D [Brassica napus]
MTRKKTNLAYISNVSARKRTLNLRKKGLLKKLDEIKTLCDVDACAVIYSPYNSTPEVWPSNSEVQKVMEKFENLPEEKQTKKSFNHEEFLNQTITKVQNQVKKLIEGNNDKLMEELMFSCLNGNMGDLAIDDSNRGNLCEFIDGHLKKLYHHKNVILKNTHLETGESSSMAMAMGMPPVAMAEAGSSFFNSPQQTNESQPLVTSNQGQEHISSHGNQFLNVPTNFPQQPNEVQCAVSSNQGLEHVPSLKNNFMCAPIFNSPLLTNESQPLPIIFSNQGANHVDSLASNLLPVSNHGVNTQVMNQDEVYYPLNQQDWYVKEMMEQSEPTCFPWMEENHHYNHRQF